ncbi:LysR family transcriptional regulator [Neptuniibacter sp. CAU 1671]|uniref:LysR family transcriptional regulator n=1 Tax=Neptuniibacter sp. CAU 1671 TaxID=3032593 RepID=UPI0023D9E660|nr:LysR family transcriptional regulator [Neptuniibacter sp. CAU 1671]MDF2182562.1 LysR family transcriptional regulator [Neptuniibacter sp. CAU 1671]
MNKLKGMEVFVQIVQNGSLTGAAHQLNTSLTSVVRTLAALESHLNVRLLNRSTRHIALTDEGREYLARCQNILSEIAEAEASLAERAAEPVGKITLTAPTTFGRMHVAPLINDFLNQFPKTQIELMLLDRPVDLLEEGVDLAVRIGHLQNSNLIGRAVGEMRQVICASPAYLARHGAPETPEALNQHQCIQLTPLNAAAEWTFLENNKQISVSIQPRLVTNQVDSAQDACKKGLGCSRFLLYQISDALKHQELSLLLENYEPAPLPVNLIYPHSRLLSKRVRALIEWLLPRLQQRLAHL